MSYHDVFIKWRLSAMIKLVSSIAVKHMYQILTNLLGNRAFIALLVKFILVRHIAYNRPLPNIDLCISL